MKKCSKCGKEKELTEFGKDSRLKSGLRGPCRKCHAEWQRNYRKNNPEIRKKQYERSREYQRKYQQENRDELNRKRREKRAKNSNKRQINIMKKCVKKTKKIKPIKILTDEEKKRAEIKRKILEVHRTRKLLKELNDV
jgi:hypothetical protein